MKKVGNYLTWGVLALNIVTVAAFTVHTTFALTEPARPVFTGGVIGGVMIGVFFSMLIYGAIAATKEAGK